MPAVELSSCWRWLAIALWAALAAGSVFVATRVGDDMVEESGKPDAEEMAALEQEEKQAAEFEELEVAVKSGEYKEPIDFLRWLIPRLSSQSTESAKIAVERQLRLWEIEARACGDDDDECEAKTE